MARRICPERASLHSHALLRTFYALPIASSVVGRTSDWAAASETSDWWIILPLWTVARNTNLS
jgi:hypothetical protein